MGTWMVVRVCGSDEEQCPSDCEHRQVLLVDAGDSDEVEPHAIAIHTLIWRFDPDSVNIIVDKIEAGCLSSKEDPLAVRRRPRPGLKSHALAGLAYLLTDSATRAAVNHE
jgi:hypothetical protein